jgi:hypothetical protein
MGTWSPIQSDSPDWLQPSARAKPPPKRMMTPHGIFFSADFLLSIL